jgi:hypothetical protein
MRAMVSLKMNSISKPITANALPIPMVMAPLSKAPAAGAMASIMCWWII